ncbi:MAG: bifunctional 23S rRNA (guanine(2069)-N(7))-methyltransferase RlmK/23S rRNA (guanine(2445)-N(2))-methyltransferase RlmL [Candidatus Pelagadaptatus aseana]
MKEMQFFATCPKGMEGLLKTEMEQLGFAEVRETVAGVYFTTDQRGAYRACLWSRLANKVFLPLGSFPVDSADALYEAARSIDWDDHLSPTGTLLVDFTGTSGAIRNTQFGAVRVKDAVVDFMRDSWGQRPSVAKRNPDLRINARLSRGKVVISIDLSGDSLHRRGYRTRQGAAPLKENLAAAILLRAGWPHIAEQGGALIDPMCGSGTILVEAAMMATDCAPGVDRAEFGFERWLNHRNDIWLELRDEALQRYRDGLTRDIPEIRGYDQDPRVIQAAQSNITQSGFDDLVRVTCKPLKAFVKPTHKVLKPGLMITNPPYGERLGEVEELKSLYRLLGDKCREELEGWQAAVFTGNPELGKHMGLRARKKYKLFNGPLPSELLLIDVRSEQFVDAPPPEPKQQPKLSEGGQMLANRLRKNRKQLAKWVKREDIHCYRLYDADMPEYAAAIDLYGDPADGGYVHVQEYAAPKSIDEDKAARRFDEIVAAVPEALEVDEERISFKQRRRNRGRDQYERQAEQKYPLVAVKEGPATLMVNLWEYLDTGLFLDHRPVRKMIGSMVRGKRFLNLFCYTATATVHAALGGAASSVSVDMSKTYLRWAEKNFQANNIATTQHRLVQSDCLTWLKECREGFDVIMLDPPSFSNSKRMEGVLDVQRDHVAMIKRCMDLLLPGGTLVFSNNLRSFKLDETALADYQIEDITHKTLDPDFQRNKRIHQCWLIRHP